VPRYEIHLPLNFADGTLVPDELFAAVRDELISRFGGLTILPPSSPAQGWWKSENVLYRDDILIYRVTTIGDEDQFFQQYKRSLAEQFKQQEIWIERVEARPIQ